MMLVPQHDLMSQCELRVLVSHVHVRRATKGAQKWMLMMLVPQHDLMSQLELREWVSQLPLRLLMTQEALRCPRESQWAKCRRFSFVVAVESA